MKKNIFVIVSLFNIFAVSAMAATQPSDTFIRINADCSTVKQCACEEVCYDVCRIVNGEQLCSESCKTVCEYSTSDF